jgi:AAA domain
MTAKVRVTVPELVRAAQADNMEVEGYGDGPSGPRLRIRDVADVVAQVAASGQPSWLVEQLWPTDAYGVVGAEDKAGKTWAGLDLGVSVVTGTPWLGHFPTGRPGPVVAFLGEGGERATVRRLVAIVRARDLELGDLRGLRLCFAVPHLTNPADLAEVAWEVEQSGPALVLVDPLYLAARGAKGSDLYAMGEALEGVQAIAQGAGAALAVVTHWNKNGEGSSARRFTGVGPGAWGRVLASAAVERKALEPDGTSVVQLRWEFTGSEIADVAFRMRRRVRATDPADLASAFTYEVDVNENAGPVEREGLSPAVRRVLAALEGVSEPGITVRDIGDRVAEDNEGPPLTKRTIQKALLELGAYGVDGTAGDVRTPGRWWRS